MPQPVESVAPTRAAAISADALSSALVQTIASLTPQQSAPITTTTATPSSAARPSFFTSSGSVSAEKKSASKPSSTQSKRRASVLPSTTAANLATLPVKNSMEQRATRSTGPTSPIAISNSAFLPAPQNSTPTVAQIVDAISDVLATSSTTVTAKDVVISKPSPVHKSVAKKPVSLEKQKQIAATIAELFKLVSLHARHARLKASEPVRACLFKQSAEDSRSNAGQIANALVEMQKLLGKKRDYDVPLMRQLLPGIAFLDDFIREGRAAALADYSINDVDDLIDTLIFREIQARKTAEYEAIGDPQDTPAL